MNKVLSDFWKIRSELEESRITYETAKDRVNIYEKEGFPLTKVSNHYIRRINQSVCRNAKKQYQIITKNYQEFLRSIKMEGCNE